VQDDSRVPALGRRDPFAPLLANPLAELFRQHTRDGAATHAVPTGGAPLPVTRYADGRERINLGTGNYLGLAGDPRVVEAAAAALAQ
jgi:7-keto-8-aminopelargonate synthetase-like enzyme